jgi:N-acetylglucosaminyldiphosphoundecaprenol N-acetyl-beta-D-mannosaminyltransferase
MMKIDRCPVLGAYISHVNWASAIRQIHSWGQQHESRYVCICNVHSVVTAARDADFNRVINNADMATPDGAPVAWAMRRSGLKDQQRINGPDLMWRYLQKAEELGQRPFFYGSTEETLQKLMDSVKNEFPLLEIAGMYAPPFLPLNSHASAAQDESEIARINQSGAHVVFVGLGCPKQERWMAAHRGSIQAVMIGVGAAFDYHAGTVKRAPLTWQRHGFEWLYRLLSEPRRLFMRYLITNTLFILGLSKQLLLQTIRSK